MKAPDKIYLQICGDCPGVDSCKGCKFKELEDNVTWCPDRIFERDVEYIRKDYLLELIEEEAKFWDDGEMIFRKLKNQLNEL